MKIKNIILLFIVCSIFSGCYIGSPSYEVFEKNMNFNVGDSFTPKMNNKFREIYSEDKYIYIGKKGQCEYGFLTNRDDNPEKVIGWIIISGKEYCKERQAYALSF